MARGKQTLAETVDPSEIVDLTHIEENAPNVLITDDFGINGGYGDFALVERKFAHKTGKEEDGENCGKVIKYTKWEDVNYGATIFNCIKNYCKYVNLTEIKKLKKCKEFEDIEAIFNKTNETVDKFLAKYSSNLSNNQETSLNLIDTINKLQSKISQVDKVVEEADELRELIKEKRRIIIGEIEPKKHRTPKDEADK